MEEIEKTLGKKIIRIETHDLDDMEEVYFLFVSFSHNDNLLFCVENEESLEMNYRTG